MRRSLLLSALSVAALAACAQDAPTVSAPELRALASIAGSAPGGGTRPLSGRCETTFNPPPLPLPPIHHQIDTGSCQLAHLGHVTLYGVQDIDFAAHTQSGERVFTAANGDVLRAVHSGTSTSGGPGLVRFSATVTFVGGTGRFAHATGEAHAEGAANLITRTTTFTLGDGWISYDASDRSGS